MTVTDIWSLAQPVQHVVADAALAGKTVAVDVSVWLHAAVQKLWMVMCLAKNADDKARWQQSLTHTIQARIRRLLERGVSKVIMVFDGEPLRAKNWTKAQRLKCVGQSLGAHAAQEGASCDASGGGLPATGRAI
jgi:hypothetical protein